VLGEDWSRADAQIILALPGLSESANFGLWGFDGLIDRVIALDHTAEVSDTALHTKQVAQVLVCQAARGAGREIHIDWPDDRGRSPVPVLAFSRIRPCLAFLAGSLLTSGDGDEPMAGVVLRQLSPWAR
jgi:hypothetical protein